MVKTSVYALAVVLMLLCVTSSALAIGYDYDFTVDSGSSTATVDVTISYFGFSDSDSDSSIVSGTVNANLDPTTSAFNLVHVKGLDLTMDEPIDLEFNLTLATGIAIGTDMGAEMLSAGAPTTVAMDNFTQSSNDMRGKGSMYYEFDPFVGDNIIGTFNVASVQSTIDIPGTVVQVGSTITMTLDIYMEFDILEGEDDIGDASITATVVATATAVDTPVVTITCEEIDDDANLVEVSYALTGDPNFIRALALEISVDNGAEIASIDSINGNYDVHPGSMVNGVPGTGSAVVTTPLPASTVIVEMGSIDDVAQTTGQLFTMVVDTVCGQDANVVITENVIRGGVVLIDPARQYDFVSPGCDVNACEDDNICPFKSFDPAYATQQNLYNEYISYGLDPNCWCKSPYDGSYYQCQGDTDGKRQTPPLYYRVYTNDLTVIVTNWKKRPSTGANPCGDIDHKKQTPPLYYSVYTNDLTRLVTHWKKRNGDLCNNCPRTDAENNVWPPAYPPGCPHLRTY